MKQQLINTIDRTNEVLKKWRKEGKPPDYINKDVSSLFKTFFVEELKEYKHLKNNYKFVIKLDEVDFQIIYIKVEPITHSNIQYNFIDRIRESLNEIQFKLSLNFNTLKQIQFI